MYSFLKEKIQWSKEDYHWMISIMALTTAITGFLKRLIELGLYLVEKF